MMKSLTILCVLGLVLHDTTAVTHSLKYFYTASSGVPGFPEYVSVGLVDDAQISYCDSNINQNIPKQEWMSKVLEFDPQYWQEMTEICRGHQQTFKASIKNIKPRFNQTGGIHLYQNMYGCEWDDETKEIQGFDQYGYDGEDFISLDLKTLTWTAPKQQAVITKQRWDKDKAWIAQDKNYLTTECIEWLKKYVNYGRSSLMRTGRIT
ncbi:major histocompatibility complex class I-related protein 1-like [Halichoeres trimaculatus]|uniref:major histocompatibility complex class I-related protein 1-like n=1 Tax=Halichoeres trimaculatus TaxID=147232 RepID=UPI003D9DD2D6